MGSEPDISDKSILKPIFKPKLLDQHARLTGNTEPNAKLIKLARSLPLHRYDWWAADAPGYPTWATASTNATKPENLDQIKLSPSAFPPWPTWDVTAPIEHVQIRFGANEVANLKQAAQAAIPHHQRNSPPISRFDALLAHLWILINRARQHQETQEGIYMNITLGLRNRIRPPLPDTFTGSPVLVGHISHRGLDTCSAEDLGTIALSIRNMVSQFTPEAVTAYLHDAAHEVSPQRLWQSFLGHNHVLATSWTRLGVYELDFCGTRPVYVQDSMPRVDGMLQVIDVGEGAKDFDISLSLESEAMRRFLGDELLRIYDR
ncbi:hypothetical protein N8I77_002800 [Diaporthe amygdali]|uniref:Uncharacterized protein n=1 Tax=Phomopsis amygdali TaxID=1214568 RepID=A0AAD9STQ4_PHOAM|nr:hypothetical protein N8I77_002800 [Diaporthe amygdali]